MGIYELYKRFPDVHPNIVLKTDLLRVGLNISKQAREQFQRMEDVLWKGYHLFSYDYQKTAVYGEKIPAFFYFEDGLAVQVRTNTNSHYFLDFTDDGFVISEHGEIVGKNIHFERKPRWYDMKTEEGILCRAIVQGFSQMMFVTMNKYCEMWNTNDQCLFCNMNTTLRDQKAGGEDVVARLSPELVAKIIKIAITTNHHYRMLYLSGGTILSRYRGQTELEFCVTRLKAIKEKLGMWIPATIQICAYDDNGWRILHDTGVGSIQPNIEVWEKRLFKWICPGKDKFIGYEEWIKRTLRAVDFWGPGRVNPNFVLGVEMAKPHGFNDVSTALKSTTSGWDFLMKHGVLPRFNLWTREAGSAFTEENQPAPPLEYLIEAQKAYTELRWKYGFDPPFAGIQGPHSYNLNCLYDFEYYEGNGITSKKALNTMLGAKSHEADSYGYDEDGYTQITYK